MKDIQRACSEDVHTYLTVCMCVCTLLMRIGAREVNECPRELTLEGVERVGGQVEGK